MPFRIPPIAVGLCLLPVLCIGETRVLFEVSSIPAGPFPSDSVTVADTRQKTGRRVNLPLPLECLSNPSLSACSNTFLLNQLDGFSVNPRITVCFFDAVDASTLPGGIWFVAAGTNAPAIPANQILYDPAGKCVHAKPGKVLDQQSRYVLAVTDTIRDAGGQKVISDRNFEDCVNNGASQAYCGELSRAIGQAGSRVTGRIVSASLFTTLSATTWLEQARRMVNHASTPIAALPAGLFNTFEIDNLKSAVWFPQDNSGRNTQAPIPLTALSEVGKIAFGLFLAPNFINVSGPLAGSITVKPTNEPIQAPVPLPGIASLLHGSVPVSFHVFLPPARKAPARGQGFPVVIYGHGLGDNQFGAPTFIANTLAEHGIATIAFEIPGHGFGAGGYVKLTTRHNIPVIVATPGRGISLAPGGPIGPTDGCILPGPVAVRDCARQSAVDLFALVRTIRKTNGLGLNLDPERIYYVGQSFGAVYGTLMHAVEPKVSKAVLSSGGGAAADVSRLAISGRPLGTLYLATSNPPLLNVPPAPPQAYFRDAFNDGYVFRDRGVTVDNVPGALPIQAAFEVAEWLGMLGDPLSFAPHLKTSPLAGVSPKQTLFQFGLGDLEVPNPMESALIRAADGQASSWFLRFERAAQLHPELLGITMPGSPLPILPHRVLSNPTIFDVPAQRWLALAAQQQVASFINGQSNPDPNQFLQGTFTNMKLFEIPAILPEELSFLQIQP